MHKGKRQLYNQLIPPATIEAGEKDQRNYGLEDRRTAMAHRYYFHAVICRKRYDDCLVDLHREFHLQPNTIIAELKTRLDFISELIALETTTAQLRKLYPYYTWVASLV